MQELSDIHSHSHSAAEVFSPFQRCAKSTACSLSAVGITATPCILHKEQAKYKKILRLCAMPWLFVPERSDVS